MNFPIFIILFIFLLIDSIENNYFNDYSFKEVSKKEKLLLNEFESINYNNLENNFLNKNLYFSENKNKYHKLNDITDNSKIYKDIINNSSFAEIPENLISRYEYKYQLEKRFKIIRAIEKKENMNLKNNNQKNNYNNNEEEFDDYFSDKHYFYGNKKLLNLDYHYYWHFLFSKKTVINNLEESHIKDIISTDPDNIIIKSKICFPITKLFTIYNPDTEDNLLIKDIKSDLYQVKIFPNIQEDYNNGVKGLGIYSSINTYFPYNIFPQSKFIFQLLILPDLIGEIKGNLYIKFNDKNVLIIPITIIGIENEYKIKPIYYMNSQLYKQLYIPIKITNPDKKNIIIIKDIIHSFNNNIKVEFPNGTKVMNNISNINSKMLHVEPNTEYKIFYLKYFPNKIGNEYGFIYLRINNDNNIVIPLIINVEHYELNPFPIFVNFGICDIKQYDRKNFIKIVPLLIKNHGYNNIEIKKVYLDYKEQFIHFHKITNDTNNKIIIQKNSYIKFGYLIFDGEYYITKDKNLYKGKIKEGTVYIETNSTINPLIGIDYFYMTDYNSVIKIKSGYIQNINNNDKNKIFPIEMLYKPPKGFKSDFNSKYNNIEIYKDNLKYLEIINQNKYLIYNIELNISITRYEKKYYYSPYIINDKLYTIFPFEINNKNIIIATFNTHINNFSLNSCINDKNICTLRTLTNEELKIYNFYYFGSISGEINRKEYFYIINNNLYPSYINKIETDNEDFKIDLENYYSLDKDGFIEDCDLSLKGKLPSLIQIYDENKENNNNNMNLILYPKTAMLLSIEIKSKNEKENESKTINAEMHLYINESSEIILINQIRILMGDFSISPSKIKFEPGFLGITQSQQIFCTNNYDFTLNIIKVKSSDSRLIPSQLTKKVMPGNKIAIINILFDPDVNSSIRRYKAELNMDKSLTYKEFYLWKKSEEYWEELGKNGKTEISADISVVTHYKTKIINVRSFIKKINLVKKEEIDYGLMQVGLSGEKYIEGNNPTDSILEMKLILAPENFNDAYDFSMFNKKEQNELFIPKNKIMTILNCNFIIKKNNTYQTFEEYILIKENLDLRNNFTKNLEKEEILKKIFEYGNENVKKYIYNSINVLCNYEKKTKDEILLNKDIYNQKFIKDIISPEFDNEINIIKNMTTNTDYKIKKEQNNYNIFSRFFISIKNIFFTPKSLPNFKLNEIKKQSFYLQENISQIIYRIQPHQNFTIGPIIFKPFSKGKVTNTLFLKNNLTILYPIKLKGEGGSGQIIFLNYLEDSKYKKLEAFNNSNYVVQINRDTYENIMKFKNNLTKSITINNIGNLPLIIKSITVDGNECQTNDLKITQCREFLIEVGESMEIDFEVITNFNKEVTNRVVKFQSDFQSFELNIIILISKELIDLKQKYSLIPIIIYGILIPTLILIIFLQKFYWNEQKEKKRENSIINGGHIESANKTNVIKENENKIKEKKKGKNKKNKKIDIEKGNNIIKNEKTAVNYKSIKTVIKTNENKKEKSETKTFGVIFINKDKQNIKIEKEKEKKKEIPIINKIENKNNEIKEELKEENKNENNNNQIEKKNLNSENNKNIINYEYTTGKINNQIDINKNVLNTNINQVLNTKNGINNNINIKININLSSKSNNTDSEENKELIQINNNEKLIEAKIEPKNNENNNNFNYNIKINEEINKDKNTTKTSKNKITTSKKSQNVKKASTLKELLEDIPSKKKVTNTKKKSKKIEKEIPKIKEIKKEEEEIKEKEIKEEEKIIEDEKSNTNNTQNNMNDDNMDDFDFNKFDFFNSDKNDQKSEDEGENENELYDNDDNNLGYNYFDDHIFGSLYDNPFCTEDKKGDLDQLLKKNK